jgi:hypothetical protein
MPETETPLNAREPTVGALPRKRTLLKLDASMNAEAPILVTPLGIVMLVKLDAPWNAESLILVRLLDPEKVTLVKLNAL